MTTSDNNLKLIAINTLTDCSLKYTRELVPGTLYQFLQNYLTFAGEFDYRITADNKVERGEPK